MASILTFAASTLGFLPVITMMSESDASFGKSMRVSVSSRIYLKNKEKYKLKQFYVYNMT